MGVIQGWKKDFKRFRFSGYFVSKPIHYYIHLIYSENKLLQFLNLRNVVLCFTRTIRAVVNILIFCAVKPEIDILKTSKSLKLKKLEKYRFSSYGVYSIHTQLQQNRKPSRQMAKARMYTTDLLCPRPRVGDIKR